MKQTSLAEALKEVVAERARVRLRVEKLTQKERALAKAEAGLRELLGKSPDEPAEIPASSRNGQYPRTTDTVLTVLESNEGKRLTASTILRHAKEAGLIDPNLKQPYGTVLEAAKRLADRDPRVSRTESDEKLWFSFLSNSEDRHETR